MFTSIKKTFSQIKTSNKTVTRTMTEEESAAFDKAFKHMDGAFEKMGEAFSAMGDVFAGTGKPGKDDIVIEEDDGNIVIKGPIKTLTVNGKRVMFMETQDERQGPADHGRSQNA